MALFSLLQPGDPSMSPRPARLPLRFLAVILDFVLFMCLTGTIFFVWGRQDGHFRWSLNGLPACGSMLLIPAYWLTTETWFQGTLGKRLINLRVFSLSGSELEFRQVVKRNVGKVVEAPTLWLFSFATVFTNPLHQTPGDMWAGTVVTEDRFEQEWRHGPGAHKFDDWLKSFKPNSGSTETDGPVA